MNRPLPVIAAALLLSTVATAAAQQRVYQWKDANGVTHHGSFTTSEDNATPYLEDDATVEIAYSRSEPARFERLSLLENNKGLGSVLTRLCISLLLMAVLAFVAHLLITRKLFVAQQEAATP